MYVKHLKDIDKENVKAGTKTSRQVLIGNHEAPNFALRKFSILPGGEMPLHTNSVEHEQLVVNGEAEVIIGNKKYHVKKDDIVFIPANVPHSYRTLGNDSFEFLCIVPNKEDVINIINP